MKKYSENLFLQAQVPENQSLEPYFTQSIEFMILCPIPGCSDIKANGFDSKFDFPVQFYNARRTTAYSTYTLA